MHFHYNFFWIQIHLNQSCALRKMKQGSHKKLQPFFKDFSRTTLEFQGPATRNIILQIVQKCTFPVYSNKTFRLELFASLTSLHFSVDYCIKHEALYVNNL